jgi:hypothetical protein
LGESGPLGMARKPGSKKLVKERVYFASAIFGSVGFHSSSSPSGRAENSRVL